MFKEMFEATKNEVKNSLSKVLYGQSPDDKEPIEDEFTIDTCDGVKNYLKQPESRKELYQQYEEMATDSIPSAVLTTYADDVFSIGTGSGNILWATAEDDDVEKESNDKLNDWGVLENARDSVHHMLKYGDEFLPIKGEKEEGIQRIDWNIHPEMFSRYDKDGKLGFFLQNSSHDRGFKEAGGQQVDEEDILEPWEVLHIKSGIQQQQKRRCFADGYYEGEYGASIFKDSLQDWKKLNIMENSVVFSRYNKSRRPLLIEVQVEGFKTRQKKQDYVQKIRQRLLRHESFQKDQNYKTGREFLAQSQPFIYGVDGKAGEIKFNDTSERIDVEKLGDVEYYRNKVIGSYQVPGAFLGLEDRLPSGIGESSLISISTRYARTVKRVQAEYIANIKHLLRIHFALKGKYVEPNAIDVHTESVTTAEDLTRSETAQNIIRAFSDLAEFFDRRVDIDFDKKEMASTVINAVNIPQLTPEKLLSEDKITELPDDQLTQVFEFFNQRASVTGPMPGKSEGVDYDLAKESIEKDRQEARE